MSGIYIYLLGSSQGEQTITHKKKKKKKKDKKKKIGSQ
jgi:hypothetical protein